MSGRVKVISRVGLVLGGLGLVGSSAGLVIASRDEGSRRSMEFWFKVFPMYAHYRSYQLLNRDLGILSDEKANEAYEHLHELYSDRVQRIVYDMRGFYLKQAQLMSTQDDFVPKAYMRWVKDTQDNVPSEFKGSEAKEYVRMKMKEESSLDFDDIFSEWDDKPLGVASIGQVHRAVLRSTGKVVAVKLLCPGLEKKFRSDIKTLKSFCQLAMPQHVPAFDEIEKQFTTEFDYCAEANNLQRIRDAVIPRWKKQVEIPAPHLSLCSKHVLVMDYLDGTKLVDGIRRNLSKMASLQGRTLEELESEMKEKMRLGTARLLTIEEKKASQRSAAMWLTASDILKYNALRFGYNISVLRLIYGPWEYHWTEQPMDLGSMLETLSHVHAYELFEVGAFNGDCHPGNILLLKDGRLGLIDYGQVKTITETDRVKMAKLVIAHARGDKSEIIRIHFDELKMVTKRMDPEVAYLMSCFYLDRDTPDVMQGMNISTFIDTMESRDPVVSIPEDFIFAFRMSILLRGMGKAFGVKMRISPLWEEQAKEFLRSRKIEY